MFKSEIFEKVSKKFGIWIGKEIIHKFRTEIGNAINDSISPNFWGLN